MQESNIRLSYVVYGTILSSLFVTVFAFFFADINHNYPTQTTDFNPSELEVYNKLNDTYMQAKEQYEYDAEVKTDRTVTDILGDLVLKSISALRTTWNSFDLFQSMADAAFAHAGLPGIFKWALISIFLLAITFFFVELKLRKDI